MQGRTEHQGITYISLAPASAQRPRNDSASIVQFPDHSLFMVWIEMHASEQGGHDTAPASIASRRSSDAGRTWQEYRIEVTPEAGDLSCYNPSLLLLPNGELLFFYLKYHRLVWNEPLEASGYIKRSRDQGQTWDDQQILWDHLPRGCANDTMVQLSDGRLLKSVEEVPVWGSYPNCVSSSSCYTSDDHGLTWSPPQNWISLPLRGTMENHIAQCRDGSLLMAVRNQLGSVFLSRSSDRGLTWSKPQTSGLTCCESMISLTRIPKTGDLLMLWNNSVFDPAFDHSGRRTPLTAAISRDNGFTWDSPKIIEDDPVTEFSNIGCLHLADGRVLVSYFTSRMENPDPPGILGRSLMSLKGALLEIDWLY